MSDDMSKWTTEERDRIVAVFEWLLKEDKKQNPEEYEPKSSSVETPRVYGQCK